MPVASAASAVSRKKGRPSFPVLESESSGRAGFVSSVISSILVALKTYLEVSTCLRLPSRSGIAVPPGTDNLIPSASPKPDYACVVMPYLAKVVWGKA